MVFRRREPHRDAHNALLEAEKNLARTKARGREVRRVTSAMRFMREDNHFIEKLDGIMGGGLL